MFDTASEWFLRALRAESAQRAEILKAARECLNSQEHDELARRIDVVDRAFRQAAACAGTASSDRDDASFQCHADEDPSSVARAYASLSPGELTEATSWIDSLGPKERNDLAVQLGKHLLNIARSASDEPWNTVSGVAEASQDFRHLMDLMFSLLDNGEPSAVDSRQCESRDVKSEELPFQEGSSRSLIDSKRRDDQPTTLERVYEDYYADGR
jgi:hypothetical protein